jgi:hypothetical protein
MHHNNLYHLKQYHTNNPLRQQGQDLTDIALVLGAIRPARRVGSPPQNIGLGFDDIDIVNSSLPGEQRSDHDLLDDEL